MQLSLFREIVVDNFAGGGGASTGIEMATGLSVDIAINHDPAAIAMHKANHPDTEHYCENVWDIDPKKAVRGRKVGLAWFSPDCTRDRFGLVTIHGEKYRIVDIGFRMLKPHELYPAQGFPIEYIFDRDYKNDPINVTDQVAKCGNSVSPVIPKVLVEANTPEFCVKHTRYSPSIAN